jgi:hypothetical protein
VRVFALFCDLVPRDRVPAVTSEECERNIYAVKNSNNSFGTPTTTVASVSRVHRPRSRAVGPSSHAKAWRRVEAAPRMKDRVLLLTRHASTSDDIDISRFDKSLRCAPLEIGSSLRCRPRGRGALSLCLSNPLRRTLVSRMHNHSTEPRRNSANHHPLSSRRGCRVSCAPRSRSSSAAAP